MTAPDVALAQLDASRDAASREQYARVLEFRRLNGSAPDWQQGEPVRVLDVNARSIYKGSGWRGSVVRVGRKLITVEYQGPNGKPVFRDFRKDTNVVNDSTGHLRLRREFEARATARREAAVKSLLSYGLLVTVQDPFAPGVLDVSLLETLVRVLDANAGRPDGEVS